MSRQLSLSLSSRKDSQAPSKRQLSERKTLPSKRPKRAGEFYLNTYEVPPGITNAANNCYCNAVIQCLFNNAHIVSQLKKVIMQHPGHCDKTCCSSGQLCAVMALKRMLEDYTVKWKSHHTEPTTSISPYAFLSVLNDLSPIFVRGRQSDSHELFVHLVSNINERGLWKGKIDFDVHVEEITRVECCKCKTSSTSLSLKSVCIELLVQDGRQVHVQDLFSEYFEPEEVTANCTLLVCAYKINEDILHIRSPSYSCKEEVIKLKTVSIANLPEILCVHVSRPSNRLHRNEKPTQVQIQNSLLKIPGIKNGVYQLTGVIVHRQLSRELGHYVAFVRSHQHLWFYANDAQVTPVSIATVLLQSPSMLFYQKVDNVECGFALPLCACKRLRGVHYLNDEIMDSYMLLISTEAAKNNKRVSSFSSLFMAKLIKDGSSSVLSWYKTVDFHQQDLMLFVINDCGNHWTLLIVDMPSKKVEYFDSMHFDKPAYWEKIRHFLDDRTKGTINWDQWTYIFREDTPEQTNGIDCGVFACQYALYRVRGTSFSFQQEHMGLLRKVMLEELLSGNLMSLKDRQNLFRQHNDYEKMYDHDIFIEPATARSLHLRDIPSTPKDTKCRQIEAEVVCMGQDKFEKEKTKIPNVCSNTTSLPLKFKESFARNFEFPSDQSRIKTSTSNHTTKPVISLSLKGSKSYKTTVQVHSTSKEHQQPSHSPFCVQNNEIEKSNTSTFALSIAQDVNQQQQGPSTQDKEQPHPKISSLDSVHDTKHHQSSISLLSVMHKETNPSVAQGPSILNIAQAWEEPNILSTPQIQAKELLQQMITSTSHEIPTPNHQLHCSLSSSNSSIKLQPSTTFEFNSISSTPPSTPKSPSAPPFSPITTEQDLSIYVPINKVTSHSQLPELICSLLPPNFTYIFESFTTLNNHHEAFNTTFYINVKTENDAKEWISQFEQQTSTTYRITKGTKPIGKRILYKTVRHCQHKRKKSNKLPKQNRVNDINQRDKKTDCCAALTVRIHNRLKSNSKIQVTHPCEINLQWNHNHSIHSAHALSFKPITDDTKQKFYDYFDEGYSPSTARHHHTMLLAIQYEGDENGLEQAHADRSVNPLPKDIDNLFTKWRQERHGKVNGESMFEILEEKIQAYNKENKDNDGRAHVQRYLKEHEKASTWVSDGSQPLVLAICTPMMARAHQMLRQSGELVYIDATSSLDRYNCPTFLISTCTPVGGIPLGVVITSGEDEATISEALSFLKAVFPSQAFYSRGSKGPQMCITDDSTAERAAIHNTWPETRLFLCIFHYLQSWWTWLWDGKQGISKEDRPVLINLIKKMVFSKSQEDLEERYNNFVKCDHPDSYIQKYPNLLKHLQTFWERRSEWALSFRMELLFRNNHTNNYAEAGIRVLKELVFGRVKAYNLIQMFNFIIDTMEKYYQNRLLDMAHSRNRPGISLRFRDIYKLTDTIVRTEQFSESIYCVSEEIKGELIEFFVDMEVGTCSCIKGLTGCECKHQAAIAKEGKVNSVNIPPFFSKQARRTFAILAVGKNKAMHLNFYANLRDDSPSTPSISNLNVDFDDTHERSCGLSEESMNSKVEDKAMQRQTSRLEQNELEQESGQESELSDHIQAYKAKLDVITNDLLMRCEKGDCNFMSGLNRFITEYGKMKTSICSTPAIAHALHMFAKDDRNSWSQRRYGKYIKVNSTGTKRRRKGLSKGSKLAPQGRPSRWKQSKYSIPNRKFKRHKRPHNLSQNIFINRKN